MAILGSNKQAPAIAPRPIGRRGELALGIVQRLQEAGFPAYWVGGCVRDFLLEKEPQDYDIATGAPPEQTERLFLRTVPVGRQFGILIVVEQDYRFEVATFRAEADYQDGRRPNRITYSDATADAQRRDFTVNGLFYDPVRRQLFDWVNGQRDLRDKTIRTIGNPAERFAEDHLRLLRAVRFAAQLGFQIEPGTLSALQTFAPKSVQVSAERIREELLKLFRPPQAARGLDLLRMTGLLAHLLPEIAALIPCEQSPDFHPEGSAYDHVRLMLELLPADAASSLPWAVLLHDIGKPPTTTRDPITGLPHFYGHEKAGADLAEAVLMRLKFPRKQIDEIAACVRHHMQFKDVPRMRKSTLRRVLMRPTFPLELELHRLDCVGSHQNLEIYRLLVAEAEQLRTQSHLRPPLLHGHDLIAMGWPAGPVLGQVLREIRERQLEDDLTSPAQARAWAQEQMAGRLGAKPEPGSAK